VRIEDRLRKFEPGALPHGLKQRTLAAAKPWRPWYLAAAAAVLVACAAVNAWSEARLHRALAGPGAAAPEAVPTAIPAESLIALRRSMEDGRQ
jgi:hypothetical protein